MSDDRFDRWTAGELSTTDGQTPKSFDTPAPNMDVTDGKGMHAAYWVLSERERAKGFVRPVRRSYVHVGARPRYPTRDLTAEELEQFRDEGYVAFESYPESERPSIGRFWTRAQLESGCGGVTRMGEALAETYARDPHFYGSTYCVHCGTHFPVGATGEFVWDGTTERVGA